MRNKSIVLILTALFAVACSSEEIAENALDDLGLDNPAENDTTEAPESSEDSVEVDEGPEDAEEEVAEVFYEGAINLNDPSNLFDNTLEVDVATNQRGRYTSPLTLRIPDRLDTMTDTAAVIGGSVTGEPVIKAQFRSNVYCVYTRMVGFLWTKPDYELQDCYKDGIVSGDYEAGDSIALEGDLMVEYAELDALDVGRTIRVQFKASLPVFFVPPDVLEPIPGDLIPIPGGGGGI